MPKVCPNCGATAPDNNKFCPNCGAQLPAAVQAPGNGPAAGYAQPQAYAPPPQPTRYSQPVQQPAQQPVPGYQPAQQPVPGYQPAQQPAFSQGYHMGPGGKMAWFKFIIYFQLFAAAVLNLVNAVSYISGLQYAGSADMVYSMIPGMNVLDKMMGILCLAMAAFAIYVRMRLAKFRVNGPLLYYCYTGGTIGMNLLYLIIGSALVSEMGISLFDANTVTAILPSVVLLICNIVYFGKRKALFVN